MRLLHFPVHRSVPRSEVPKAICLWCGSQRSTVYRSNRPMTSDDYRRRCLECIGPDGEPRTWSTLELPNRTRFLRELQAEQVAPADLGLEPAA